MDASTATATTPNPTKPKRVRPPKQRTPALRRGRACVNCRHLKIVLPEKRCDGVQPICGNCVRVPKERRCTFNVPSGRSKLGHEDKHVDTGCCPTTFLDGDGFSDYSLASTSRLSTPALSPGELCSDTRSEASSSDFDWLELSAQTIQTFVQHFLPHAQELGFFLDVECLHAAAALAPTLDLFTSNNTLPPHPTTSLLFAAALWGAHLSKAQVLTATFLRRALECISTEICSLSLSPSPLLQDTTNAVQIIQAQLLIARYFISNGQTLAARVQASGAEAIATALGSRGEWARWAVGSVQTMAGFDASESVSASPSMSASPSHSPYYPIATSATGSTQPEVPFYLDALSTWPMNELQMQISDLDWDWAARAFADA
ncbi:hypothetical protein C8F01DRAFT_1267577 [Mycena amicta]|nr:hypothetical protein C8F01DRAFT_1267577 [Mycena amicta]